jgi:hypothetical protein
MHDALGRGVRPMRRPEGVVDVRIGEIGQLFGKGRIVRFLTRVKPDVLEKDDAPGVRPDRLFGGRAHAVGRKCHRPPKERAEMVSHRAEAELRVGLSLRTAEV